MKRSFRRAVTGLVALVVGVVPVVNSVLASSAVYAQISEEDLYFYNQNRIYFWDSSGVNCTSMLATGNLIGGSVQEKVIHYFAGDNQYGIKMTDNAIAGVLANFWGESNFNPFRFQSDSVDGQGYGIAQFTDKTKITGPLSTDPRTAGYFNDYYDIKYTYHNPETGYPKESVPEAVMNAWLEVQLDFIANGELTTYRLAGFRNDGGVMGLDYLDSNLTILEAMNAAKTAEDATRVWTWIYERPQDKPTAASQRETMAGTYLAMVKEALAGGTNTVTGTNGIKVTTGSNVTIVGDSITERTKMQGDFRSILPDADIYSEVGKHLLMDSGSNLAGATIIDDLISSGNLREVVVVALGTNDQGGLTKKVLQDLVDKINADGTHAIVFVTNYAREGSGYDYTSNNNAIKEVKNTNSNVVVADWAAAVEGNDAEYMDDDLHPMYGVGTKLFAQTIYSALTNGVTGASTMAGAASCNNNGIINGVTKKIINGKTYAFPLAYATKENYLSNTATHPSVLSSPGNNWAHHATTDRALDMGIYYADVTGHDFTLSDYPEWNAEHLNDAYLARCDSRFGVKHCNSSTGAPVVAITEGTITWYNHYKGTSDRPLAEDDVAVCAALGLETDDGQYYYVHLGYEDEFAAKVGQHVNAGDVIGHVGVSPCAQYTQAHVHLNMNGDSSDRIVELVSKLYNELPANMAELAARETSIAEGGLTYEQAKTLMMHYGENKNDSSLNTVGEEYWNLCGGGGSNCVTFSAFFLNKFTKTSGNSLPDGKDVVNTLKVRGAQTGTDPRVWAVFSWTNSGYGHTGVILGYHDGEWIVGHASCSRGKNGNRGEGDGTSSGGGSGVVVKSSNIVAALWGGSDVSNIQYAYFNSEVDLNSIAEYLNTGV